MTVVLQPWPDLEVDARRGRLHLLAWAGGELEVGGDLLDQVEFFAPPPDASSWILLLARLPRLRWLQLFTDEPGMATLVPDHIAVHGMPGRKWNSHGHHEARVFLRRQLARVARGQEPLHLLRIARPPEA